MTTSHQKKDGTNLFKSVFMAYFILAFHIILIAAVGTLILFFRGIILYMAWILIGGSLLITLSGYLIYKRMQKEGMTLRETLNSPLFSGRSVEVSLLGGLASFKVDRSENMLPGNFPAHGHIQPRQLEDPAIMRVRHLTELAKLLENDLITLEEYNKAKEQVLKYL